jgi:hypothetical protein
LDVRKGVVEMTEAVVRNADVRIVDVDIRDLIQKAVNAGRSAERKEAKQRKNPFLAETERRLYSYPDLNIKVRNDLLDIQDLEKEKKIYGGTSKAKDIVFMPKGGVRLDPEERQQALIDAKNASMEKTKKEIAAIDKVIETLSFKDAEKTFRDEYVDIIKLKYFKCMKPEEIAELIKCDKVTVYRNCSRLLNRLMVIWYGEEAFKKG